MKQLYALCPRLLKRAKWIQFFAISLLLSNAAMGQVSITAIPQSYAEDFNSFVGSAASVPAGWTAASSGTAVNAGIGSGTSTTGGYWAYGTSSEYCLGALRSGTPGNITYTVSFTNNTGSTITSLTFAWDYEQWRYAGNTTGWDCTATGALAGNATINSKDFAGAASGTNGTVTTTAVSSFTLTGLSIANGSTFGLSFATTDQSGSDNGVGIDNFSLLVPTPCTNPSISGQPSPASQSACQNLTPSNLSITASGTLPTYQWYSNTVNSNSGGSSILGATLSTYTPPTSVTGTTYYYCIVSGCSNSVTSNTASVTVSAPPSATISYPNTPFCSNAGTQTVIRTGSATGSYSAPAGLNINSSSGDINPALSTAGTYTVTYSMPAAGGCGIQTATTSVTVTALPAATISYPSASVCKTAGTQTVNRTGTAGGTYTASPAGLSINSGTGLITPSTSTEGTYTVTYTMTAPGNGCTVDQTTTTTISIKSTATSIAPAATQDLSINNDGTTLTVTEGDVPVSRQWMYGTTPGGPYTINLGVGTTQIPNFSSIGTYYIVCVTTYPASPCGGATVTSNEVQINVTNNAVVTTPATYGPFCNNVNNPVTVNFTYSPAVNFTAGVTVFTAQLSDGTGSFASPTNIGNVISDASGGQAISAIIPSGVTGGTAFRIRVRSTGPNSIGTDNDNDFIVGGFPSATISYQGAPYCSTAGVQTVNRTGTPGGTYSSTAGLTIDPSTGTITPSTSTPGTYTVTYSMPVVGTCPAQTTTTSVTITASPAATISYTTSPFCSNGGVQTVTRTGTAGGSYSSTAGLTINSGTGAITPSTSTPGTYIVSYTVAAAGGCAVHTDATSITITQAPAATISYTGTPFCANDFSVKAVTRTGTTGGTYTSSPAGLSINASTGDINIFASTVGSYTVTYSMNSVGGCPVQTATTNVTINTAPVVADITGTTTITLPGSTSLSDATPSGVWTSSNTAVATVNASGVVTGVAAGTTVIKYTVTSGGCSNFASTAVNVLAAGGVGIWSNDITDANPSATNPFTAGQVVSSNISVSGIGYSGAVATAASNRFNTNTWETSASINTSKYIYFTLTPDAGYAIDFTSFVYTDQVSNTGPAGISIRSSVDGFATDIATIVHPVNSTGGGSVSLTGAAFQNITNPITFRIYGYNASATGGTYSVNDFTFYGNLRILCGSPTAIEIVTQPTFVAQDAVMSPVLVRAKCADGNTAAGYTGSVVLSVFNGCGYTTQTVNAVGGIANFSNIVFRRSAQSNVKLQAFAAGFSSVLSDTFSVTAPGGSASTTTIASENFEGSSTWSYAVGSDVAVGSGGTSGVGVVTIKTFSANKSLVKSYSVDNSSGKLGSTNTITFANQTISAAYSSAKFNFQIASLGTGGVGSGAGHDNGESMLMEISLDGGSTWDKLLTYTGNGDYLFNLSAAPIEALAYNANASYAYPSTQSAFSVSLPSGATQFRFRITATNNRTNENWAIDNISLVGTAVAGAGVTNPLPIVTNDNIVACPNSNTTITLVASNTVGVVSYVWSPASNLTNATISNPVANPPGPQVYTATITDADGCSASGTYTITNPGGTTGTWYGYNNSDWFQCGNWGGGVIPTNATNVTIPGTATNIAEIDPLSTYAAAFSGIARANNITVDNKTLRTQANANLNIAGNLLIQNSGLLDMTNGGQVDLTGSWTNSVGAAGFTSGIGTINYTGSAAQTVAPENYYNLTSSSTGSRTMPAGTVGVAGTFTKGSNTYSFTSGNTVNYNGNAAQSIAAFTAGVSTGATYDNLTLSNTGTKSLSGNTDVESDLTLSNTIQLALGSNYLALKSTATKTARVAPVSAASSISYGTGRFIVERYFPGKRAWRLVTSPVTIDATKSFFNTIQVGGSSSVSATGTYITGPGETAANGLDVSPQHNYSLKTFNQLTSQYDGIANTKTTLISGTGGVAGTPDNFGYFIFVRGDRTAANPQPFNPSVIGNATVLKDTGKIQTQSYTFNCNPSAGTHKYTLIGNPYASPVDFASLTRNNVANKFWAWDPNLNGSNGVGGYAIVDLSLGTVTTVPVGGSTTQTQIIQSRQAVLVETTGGSPTVTFGETAKSPANNLNLFRPTAPAASLIANLYIVNADGTDHLADGVLAQYNDKYAAGEDQLDALKFTNVNESFSIKNGSSYYMLERRPFVQAADTIFFNLNRARQMKYRFNLILDNIIRQKNRVAYLEDRYLHSSTPLNMHGSTWVDFEVNGNAGSSAANRFFIVFKKAAKFSDIHANVVVSDVAVNWIADNAALVDRYEIERSLDGVNFSKVGTTDAAKNGDELNRYQFSDLDPAAGIYYYRVKAVSSNYGVMDYTDAVKVKVTKGRAGLYVYPNPVTNNVIGLKMGSAMPEGVYTVRLMSSAGQVIVNKQLQYSGTEATQFIACPSGTTGGTYQLEVTGPDKKKSIIPVVVIQQ